MQVTYREYKSDCVKLRIGHVSKRTDECALILNADITPVGLSQLPVLLKSFLNSVGKDQQFRGRQKNDFGRNVCA